MASHQARRPGVFGAEGFRHHLTTTSPNYPAGLGACEGPSPNLSPVETFPRQRASVTGERAGVRGTACGNRPTTHGFVIPSSFAIRHSAFTLLEILVVLGLLMMLFGVSIISISGIKEEDRLRRASALIETTARQNLLQAVREQKTLTLPLAAGSFGSGADFGGLLQIRRVGERAFRQPKHHETWEFSPTGICEPIEVRLTGPGGTIELAFDALTACAKRKSLDFNAKS